MANFTNIQKFGSYGCYHRPGPTAESHVIVRHFPSSVATRYLGLVKCGKWREINGKRVLKYSFTIADSTANSCSRDAEPGQQSIHWIDEGGAFLTLTEVDETKVHAQFTHWTCCTTEIHAQSHFITFGHTVTRWEQLVSPSRFLTFE